VKQGESWEKQEEETTQLQSTSIEEDEDEDEDEEQRGREGGRSSGKARERIASEWGERAERAERQAGMTPSPAE
jgi:hypothetical protein